ncbi:MAG: hypothetical protein E6I49_00175 [Chloroflexi bacterium]|nr:MAG: hypothetical protein E6I49_00175 [Chloroflexota bacterium]
MARSSGNGISLAISATETLLRATNVPAAPMLRRSSFLASAAVEKMPDPPTLAARTKMTWAPMRRS